MGMTMTHMVLARAAGLEQVQAGQLIEAQLDLVLGNDITSPVAIKEMDKMKVQGVFDCFDNIYNRFISIIFCMKMWWIVIFIIHCNPYSIKQRNFWHRYTFFLFTLKSL